MLFGGITYFMAMVFGAFGVLLWVLALVKNLGSRTLELSISCVFSLFIWILAFELFMDPTIKERVLAMLALVMLHYVYLEHIQRKGADVFHMTNVLIGKISLDLIFLSLVLGKVSVFQSACQSFFGIIGGLLIFFVFLCDSARAYIFYKRIFFQKEESDFERRLPRWFRRLVILEVEEKEG